MFPACCNGVLWVDVTLWVQVVMVCTTGCYVGV